MMHFESNDQVVIGERMVVKWFQTGDNVRIVK